MALNSLTTLAADLLSGKIRVVDLTQTLSPEFPQIALPPEKGALKAGNDADLVLVDLEKSFEVKREDLLDRHRQSPYVGRALKGKIIRTVLRGQTIFKDGTITAKPAGRLVKPVLAAE